MKISYQRTFSQFVDTYIARYYSGAFETLQRLLGGPFLIVLGVIAFGTTRRLSLGIGFTLVWMLGFALVFYGIFYTLRPAIQIGLVYLRRGQFLGEEGARVTLSLDAEAQILLMDSPEGHMDIPLKQIRNIQHRQDSTWIITTQDLLLTVPRQDLLEGEHDPFFAAVEAILDENEQKY